MQYSGHTVVAHRVLVKFQSPPSQAELSQLRANTTAAYLEPLGGAGWYDLRAPSWTIAQLLSLLGANPNVVKAEPDFLGKPMVVGLSPAPAPHLRTMTDHVPNDPNYPLQWAFNNTGQTVGGIAGTPGADISAPEAWGYTTGNRQMVLVDYDTGIDYNNPDLGPNVWSAPHAYTITEGGNVYNCLAGAHGFNAIDNESGCASQVLDNGGSYGHGTLTAGTMDAVSDNGLGVAGTASNVTVLPITICTDQCDSATAITGIDASLQIALQFGLHLVAGNLSHGDLGGSAMADEMALAGHQDGLLFVASTGDECRSSADDPASFYLDNEIAVSASDQNDQVAHWDGGCSNGGGDLAAPGKHVYTTILGDDGTHPLRVDETSISAPFVTGALGLLASACPLVPVALKATIEGTADSRAALDSIATNGRRLNMGAALASCASTSATPSTTDIEVSLDPDPFTPDYGEIYITIGSVEATVDYDTSVDTADSLAEAIASLVSSVYVDAEFTGDGTVSLTTLAKGPYTVYPYYTIDVQIQDDCAAGGELECGTAPDVSAGAFGGGHS